jgi:hypothetical protein
VQIVGRGTVSPNYNGVLLAVNVNYAMKASALSGFGFTNWTGSVTTNSATVRFTMQPNLALTANFVDVTRPTLSIMTPRARQQWTNGVITMTGKAGDNVAVAAVYYSLNESGWVTASTANGWTNWTADGLVLVAGTNTLRAYAVDASGNFSTTSTVQVYDVEQDLSTNTVAAASTVAAVLESPAYTKGVYAFEVTGEAGFKYVVEASTNLVNWDPVLTNTAPFTFVDPLASQFNQRFYRSVSVP